MYTPKSHPSFLLKEDKSFISIGRSLTPNIPMVSEPCEKPPKVIVLVFLFHSTRQAVSSAVGLGPQRQHSCRLPRQASLASLPASYCSEP